MIRRYRRRLGRRYGRRYGRRGMRRYRTVRVGQGGVTL